jgi:hypothetical protein
MQSVNLRAPDGRCLFVNPLAGDFRQNLIPVELVECGEQPNQKWDVVTAGKHNDGDAGRALLVNVLTNGCISFDNRRPRGDKVTVFSCGGRANGGKSLGPGEMARVYPEKAAANHVSEGETDRAQLYPFSVDDIPETSLETTKIVLEPLSGDGQSCLVAGRNRLQSGRCSNEDAQVFELVKVLPGTRPQ